MSLGSCFRLSTVVLAIAVGAPALAQADSLVFVKNGRVQVAQADGTQGRPVSPAGHWAWPSESNGGKIAALSTEDSKVYEYNQQGASLLSSPMFTAGSTFSQNASYYVNHTRISPDGTRMAYNVVGCCGFSGQATFQQPMKAGGSGWNDFADDYINPVWVNASTANDPYVNAKNGLGMGSNGYNWTGGCCQYGIWNADNAKDNGGYESDSAIPGSDWEFEVAFSRNLLRLALFLDDSPAFTGVAHHVEIVLETVHRHSSAPNTDDCTIPVPAGRYSEIPQGVDSISYSSNGSLLAWATDRGIFEANVANPSDCTAVKNSVHLAVAGGAYPYFGAAALSAKVTPPPNTAITSFSVNHRARRATVHFTGSGGVGRLTFRCRLDGGPWVTRTSPVTATNLRKGRNTLQVAAVDSRGKVDPTPATVNLQV